MVNSVRTFIPKTGFDKQQITLDRLATLVQDREMRFDEEQDLPHSSSVLIFDVTNETLGDIQEILRQRGFSAIPIDTPLS